MPLVPNQFDQTLTAASHHLADKWIQEGGKNASADDIKGWSAGQIVVFLDKLNASPEPLPLEVLKTLGHLYGLSTSRNSEIRFRWYSLGIVGGNEEVMNHAAEFLKEQGRMKFVRPLYRALYKSAKGKELAVQTFKQHRNNYHSIAQKNDRQRFGSCVSTC